MDKELRQQVDDCIERHVMQGDILQEQDKMVTAVVDLIKQREEALDAEMQRMARTLIAIRAGHTLTLPAGFGKTVEYDLSPAMVESALRAKLIELGWTPPAIG